MKLTRLLLQGIACTALGIGTVCANPLVVYMSAHVTAVDDVNGALAGQVTVGQTVSGIYRYETTPSNTLPPVGLYPQSPGQAGIRIPIGSFLFQSDAQGSHLDISVIAGTPSWNPGWSSAGFFNIESRSPVLVADNLWVNDIRINFQDPLGYAPYSTALPADLPDLTRYTQSTISITGGGMPGEYAVTLAIDSVTAFPPSTGTWSLSPGTGTYSRAQRIDAALLIPATSPIQSMQLLFGGRVVSDVLGNPCMIQGNNTRGQTVVLCPNLLSLLPDGVNQVEWQIQLADGTMLDKGAVWELIP